MIQKTTRRGQTQEVANQNSRHAEKSLLSISSALTTQGGNPEQKRCRMTSIVKKKGHSRRFLSGIFNACCCKTKDNALLNRYVEDPRLQPSGMTTHLMSGSRLTYTCCSGFTLIELLVVVLIIGILATVALPQYNKAVKKAQGVEVLTALDALNSSLTTYYLEHGTYEGAGTDTLSADIPELRHFRYAVGCDSRSYQTGSKQFNSSYLQTRSHRGQNTQVNILSKDIVIVSSFQSGHLSSSDCSVMQDSTLSCADYFNCVASPRSYVPQSGSTAAHYAGGGCNLK